MVFFGMQLRGMSAFSAVLQVVGACGVLKQDSPKLDSTCVCLLKSMPQSHELVVIASSSGAVLTNVFQAAGCGRIVPSGKDDRVC